MADEHGEQRTIALDAAKGNLRQSVEGKTLLPVAMQYCGGMVGVFVAAELAQVVPQVVPQVAPVVDPRSIAELLIQAVGAVVMLVGVTALTRQLIYKQFGRENYAATDFRKGMLRGALWLVFGVGIIAVAILLSPRLR